MLKVSILKDSSPPLKDKIDIIKSLQNIILSAVGEPTQRLEE